jgi:hypothetical protein
VFFNVTDVLEMQRLIELRKHFWKEHIMDRQLISARSQLGLRAGLFQLQREKLAGAAVLYDSFGGRQSCLDRVASDGFQNFNSHGPVWPQTAKRNAEAFAVVDVGATAAPLYNARGGGFG